VFEPDIIVTSSQASAPVLVVEAKLHLVNSADAEEQLKRYMLEAGCRTGLLVTSDRLRIYRDRFKRSGEDSIEFVGEYDLTGTLGRTWREAAEHVDARERGVAFEREVQAWLESLPSVVDELPSPLREAIDEHVGPVLAQGEVRAAGPRWRARAVSAT